MCLRESGPISVTVDPSGRFAYAANAGSDSVSVYTIDQATGALTSGPTVTAGSTPQSVTVDPSGRFVYVANRISRNVYVYRIDQSTGALTTDSIATAGTTPQSVVVHPTGKFAYVANEGDNNISIYSIDQTTGTLISLGTTSSVGVWARSVDVDPSGRFLYVVELGSNTVSKYTVNQTTGALTDLATVATGTSPMSVTVDPSGKFVYVANKDANTVSAYTIDQITGVLVSGATVTAGTNPYSVIVDPSGNFAYVANMGSDNVSVYAINTTTGALTPAGDSSARSGPASVKIYSGGSVAANVAVTGVSLNKSEAYIPVYRSEQLTATVTPWNASNKKVTWSSSDTAVATVSSTGLVTVAAVGSAAITATTADGSFVAKCTVVPRAPKSGAFDGSGGTMVVWTQYDGAYNKVYANRHNGTSDTWGAATLIGPATGNASSPQVGFDSNNNAIVVWLQSDGTHNSVYANRYNTSMASWGTPTLIGPATGDASFPRMDFDGSGGTMVVWTQNDGTSNKVYANRHNGTMDQWGAAASVIGPATGNASLPQVGYNSNNNAIVVWLQSDGTHNSVYANRYGTSQGLWTTATLIGPASGDASFPRMDFDASGGTMVVWSQNDGTYNSVYANRHNGTMDQWAAAASLIGPATGNASLPQVGYNANNNAIVVWLQNDGTHNSVYANRYYTSMAQWQTTPTLIGPASGDASLPRMDFDTSGGTMVVWTQNDGTSNRVYANRHNGTSDTWGASAAVIGPATGNASLPQVGYNANNNAIVVWLQNDGTHNSVYANRYYTSMASWTAATLIGPAAGDASLPQIDFDGSGGTMVVWSQNDGTYNSVYANRHNGTSDTWGGAALIETNTGNASLPLIGLRRVPPGSQGFSGSGTLFYNANNNAIVVWLQNDGTYNSVYANRYNTGQALWGTAGLIETYPGNAFLP